MNSKSTFSNSTANSYAVALYELAKENSEIDKIADGKLNKFINDNSLLNQEWIMDPKKKVKDILKEVQGKNKIKINNFFRFKVGEGL